MCVAWFSVLILAVVAGTVLAAEKRAAPAISAASVPRIAVAGRCASSCRCNCVTRPAPAPPMQRYGWIGARWPWCPPRIYDRMPYDRSRSLDYPWNTGARRPLPFCPPPY